MTSHAKREPVAIFSAYKLVTPKGSYSLTVTNADGIVATGGYKGRTLDALQQIAQRNGWTLERVA